MDGKSIWLSLLTCSMLLLILFFSVYAYRQNSIVEQVETIQRGWEIYSSQKDTIVINNIIQIQHDTIN